MSSAPLRSALDSQTQMFPVLTAAQIDRMRPLGKVRQVETGEIVFEPSTTGVPFFVLLSGSMEVVQPTINGERAVATHGPGEFTGEITMIPDGAGWFAGASPSPANSWNSAATACGNCSQKTPSSVKF